MSHSVNAACTAVLYKYVQAHGGLKTVFFFFPALRVDAAPARRVPPPSAATLNERTLLQAAFLQAENIYSVTHESSKPLSCNVGAGSSPCLCTAIPCPPLQLYSCCPVVHLWCDFQESKIALALIATFFFFRVPSLCHPKHIPKRLSAVFFLFVVAFHSVKSF